MAAIKQTESGKWWPVHGKTGKVLRKDVPRGGYATKAAAKRKAAEKVARNTGRTVRPSQIEVYDK